MRDDLLAYRQRREALITQITQTLSNDERFVAAWLAGSYGRNEADEVSDLDLRLVVSGEYSTDLCLRLEQVSARTSPERYALFSQFGNPALIHENNNNAPEGGTFTFVLYAGSALMVDWVLMPYANAERSFPSILLFDKVNIPVSPPSPEDLDKSRKRVAEQWAFFWMMTAITIKYAIRDDLVFVQEWLEILHGLMREIERLIERVPWEIAYKRGSLSKLQPTREKQIESLRLLCKRMQALEPKVSEFTGSKPLMPLAEIEILFALSNT